MIIATLATLTALNLSIIYYMYKYIQDLKNKMSMVEKNMKNYVDGKTQNIEVNIPFDKLDCFVLKKDFEERDEQNHSILQHELEQYVKCEDLERKIIIDDFYDELTEMLDERYDQRYATVEYVDHELDDYVSECSLERDYYDKTEIDDKIEEIDEWFKKFKVNQVSYLEAMYYTSKEIDDMLKKIKEAQNLD